MKKDFHNTYNVIENLWKTLDHQSVKANLLNNYLLHQLLLPSITSYFQLVHVCHTRFHTNSQPPVMEKVWLSAVHSRVSTLDCRI
jgi:hypothetical protein